MLDAISIVTNLAINGVKADSIAFSVSFQTIATFLQEMVEDLENAIEAIDPTTNKRTCPAITSVAHLVSWFPFVFAYGYYFDDRSSNVLGTCQEHD